MRPPTRPCANRSGGEHPPQPQLARLSSSDAFPVGFENLQGLNILVISPNEWGDMRLSKHHYAVSLARQGNRVFFLNPPDARASERLRVQSVADAVELYTVTYRPYIPFAIRFRSRHVYDLIARAHVHWLLRTINVRFDVVWCFDVNLYSDLRWFGARLKIFHPVDQVSLPYQIDPASTADMVLSVSNEILRKTVDRGAPQFRIEHGLAPEFVALAERRSEEESYRQGSPVKVGYVGNLLMPYIDRELLLRLVSGHKQIEFHMWGPRSRDESNVGSDESLEGARFVRALESMPNVRLHGSVRPSTLAKEIREVDLLLMCYAVKRDPNGGCNSHKLLEYLSTGRVVVANHVSDYADKPGLVEMVAADGQENLIDLFDSVVHDLDRHNDRQHRQRRLLFALDNSYSKQIGRIADCANEASQRESREERARA
jgi:hypothetical protein